MLFHKPVVPKPLDRWSRDEAAVLRLREIVNDPVFQLAAATLLAAAQPAWSSSRGKDAGRKAADQDWLAGYNDFARDMQRLTVLKAPGEVDLAEWQHITPDKP